MNQYQTHYQECSAPSSSSSRTEIGDQAVWTLSSSKPGNGIEQLRDDNNNTFWQSDGSQPHTITIQFMKKVKLMEVGIYLDFKCDESYTPNKISFRVGGNVSDLREYVCLDLKEPVGWFIVPFKTIQSNGVEKLKIIPILFPHFHKILQPPKFTSLREYISTMNIQICILQNQHSGKDTHVRQVKVFGPKEQGSRVLGFPEFNSVEFTQYQDLR